MLNGLYNVRTIFSLVGGVLVRDTCGFKHQLDELAASGDTGPVQQLVRRMGARLLVR